MKKLIFTLSILGLLTVSCEEKKAKTDVSTTVADSTQTEQQSQKSMADMSVAERIAHVHGIDKWDQVEEVSFTFNVSDKGEKVAKRNWVWRPKSGMITQMQAESVAGESYNQKQMDSTQINMDKRFVNDIYWLLPAFKMVWDEDVVVQKYGQPDRPAVILMYGNEGGYTPSDKYVIYHDGDYKLTEWEYYREGVDEPTMINSFEDYQDFNGIKVAMEHKLKDNDVRIFFTNVDFQFSDTDGSTNQ